MQHNEAALPITVEYARTPRPAICRRLAFPVVLVLLLFVALVGFWVGVKAYVAHEWSQLTSGMARAQVDRKLWAFRSYPYPQYLDVGPGDVVIRYELFGMGKATMIQVIYSPDGTMANAHPVFDD